MILGRMITGNEVPQAFLLVLSGAEGPEVLAARPEPAAKNGRRYPEGLHPIDAS